MQPPRKHILYRLKEYQNHFTVKDLDIIKQY